MASMAENNSLVNALSATAFFYSGSAYNQIATPDGARRPPFRETPQSFSTQGIANSVDFAEAVFFFGPSTVTHDRYIRDRSGLIGSLYRRRRGNATLQESLKMGAFLMDTRVHWHQGYADLALWKRPESFAHRRACQYRRQPSSPTRLQMEIPFIPRGAGAADQAA